MQRNVYLEGEIGEKFGSHYCFHAPKVKDALRLIDINNSGFKKYLLECQDKGIGFAIDVAGEEIEYNEELLLPLHEGDITITAIPEGGGGGFKKILTAVAIVLAIYYGGQYLAGSEGLAVGEGAGFGAKMQAEIAEVNAVTFGVGGYVAMGVAINLAMTGLNEMMAPDPSTDDSEQSYLFNGSEQNVIEGDPVPVLYGHLRIPGQPINFEVANTARANDAENTALDLGMRGHTMLMRTLASISI